MQRRFLNVGGGSKSEPVRQSMPTRNTFSSTSTQQASPTYAWTQGSSRPSKEEAFDAVYCSHNLEHYFAHEVPLVLKGFLHVLKDDGFAEIRVPDMQSLFKEIVSRNLDIDDELYRSVQGPILVRDVIYGFGQEIEKSGVDFYAHRTGFSPSSLTAALKRAGFAKFAFVKPRPREIAILAFKHMPSAELRAVLGFKPQNAKSSPAS